MNGTTVQNPHELAFLSFHSTPNAILVNFQPNSSLSQLTLYSYHDLYDLV